MQGKGLSDTALKTANSGYLTRRLVDVAQDCIVRMHDCGTDNSITAEPAVNDGEVITSLAERVLGRVAAEDIKVPGSEEIIVREGQLIDELLADSIDEAGLVSARIRSPLTCDAEEGVCAMCYGRDLARGTMVNTGEAVGIIAAQSIGEPGTQLTMRTFHIGGVAQGGQQSFLESSQDGKIEFENATTLKNASGETLVMGRNMKLRIMDEHGVERANHKLDYGTKLFVKKGSKVSRGDKLFEWDPYTLPIIAEKGGTAKYVDLVNGVAVREDTDDATGMTQKIVVDWRTAPKGNDLKPEIILVDENGEPVRNDAGNPITYPMSVDAILSIEDGSESRLVMWLQEFREKELRQKTSQVVFRGLQNFLKLDVLRITLLLRRLTATFDLGVIIRTSVEYLLSQLMKVWKPLNIWYQKVSIFLWLKVILSKRAITSWMVTRHRTIFYPLWVLRH